MAYLTSFLTESWHVFLQASPFLLFGFFIAGMLKALVPVDLLVRHFGGRGFLSVLKGALLGAPLPLCSCGVLPAAMGLRRQGAGAGATTAFMIATPETGVDSLAVTYALIDPLMTVLRPVAAVVTAIVAGVAANLLPEHMVALPKSGAKPVAKSDAKPDAKPDAKRVAKADVKAVAKPEKTDTKVAEKPLPAAKRLSANPDRPDHF